MRSITLLFHRVLCHNPQEETDAKVKDSAQLATAAELFRVDAAAFDKCLTYRKITRPGSKSVTYAHYSIAKAKVRLISSIVAADVRSAAIQRLSSPYLVL